MTALTKTGVCNLAFREMGAYRIEGDVDTEISPEARTARDVYDQARRFALCRQEWGFAMKFAQLTQLAETPVAKWDFAYQLPPDFIRLGVVADNDTLKPALDEDYFEIRDGKLYASSDYIFIDYVYDHTTVGAWPPQFVNVVVGDLAAAFAAPLKSTAEKEGLLKLASARFVASRSIDSAQQPVMRPPEGRWVQAMRGNRRP